MLLFAVGSEWIPIIGAIGILIWVVLRRSFRRQPPQPTESRKPLIQAKPGSEMALTHAPSSVLRWQVAIFEMSRTVKGELDSKMMALNTLIAMAREERQRLEDSIAHARQLGIAPCADTLATLEQLAYESDEVACEQLAALAATAANRVDPSVSEQWRDVYGLADQGKSMGEIARQLELPIGDVELALSLRSLRD